MTVLGHGCRKGANDVIATPTVPFIEQTADTNLLNLLIVEDERGVRDCCREVARSLGFGTQVAESREEAETLAGVTLQTAWETARH